MWSGVIVVRSAHICPVKLQVSPAPNNLFPGYFFFLFSLFSQGTCLLASFSISPFYLFSHIALDLFSALHYSLAFVLFLTSLVYFLHNSTLQYYGNEVMDDLGPRINFKFSSLKKK